MDIIKKAFENVKLPKLDRAFFCCSLETATHTICLGCLVVYGILFLAYCDLIAFMPRNSYIQNDNSTHNMTNDWPTDISDELIFQMEDNTMLDIDALHFLENTVIIQLLFSFSLLIGIIQRNYVYLFAWVALQVSVTCHTFLVIILSLLTVYQIPVYTFFFILEQLAMTTLSLYCSLIVYSYMLIIKNPRQEEQH